jgi:hypothetical protein
VSGCCEKMELFFPRLFLFFERKIKKLFQQERSQRVAFDAFLTFWQCVRILSDVTMKSIKTESEVRKKKKKNKKNGKMDFLTS